MRVWGKKSPSRGEEIEPFRGGCAYHARSVEVELPPKLIEFGLRELQPEPLLAELDELMETDQPIVINVNLLVGHLRERS